MPVVAQSHNHTIEDATVCEFDFHSRKLNIKYFHFCRYANQSAALNSTTQHTILPEPGVLLRTRQITHDYHVYIK